MQKGDDNLPDRIRQKVDKLPPEERAKFVENFRQWQAMGDEERARFRERGMREMQKIQNAVDEALKKTGLTLDPERREVFSLRYMQERKKIERTLRAEMEAKRDKSLDEMLEKLKTEFAPYSKPQPASAETPAAAATP